MFQKGILPSIATFLCSHMISNHTTWPVLCSRLLSVWCCRVYCVAARGPNLLVSAGCGVTVHDLATGQAIRYGCSSHVNRSAHAYPGLWVC